MACERLEQSNMRKRNCTACCKDDNRRILITEIQNTTTAAAQEKIEFKIGFKIESSGSSASLFFDMTCSSRCKE